MKTSYICGHCEAGFKDKPLYKAHIKQRCIRFLSLQTPRVFSSAVAIPKATKKQLGARVEAVVVRHRHSTQTAIELRRGKSHVTYIKLSLDNMRVEGMGIADFDSIYSPISDYPTGRAAKLYVGFITRLGGTEEALAELGKLVVITSKEKEMSNTKEAARKASTKPTKGVKTLSKNKSSESGGRKPRESAARMFRELIMEGRLTDDKIFDKVQAKFILQEEKRKIYVSYYRSNLKRAGKNPPEKKAIKKVPAKKKAIKKVPAKKKAIKKVSKKA